MARVVACGIGGVVGIRGVRTEGREKKLMIGVFGETIELSGKVLKNTCDLACDLLEAKTRALQTYPT